MVMGIQEWWGKYKNGDGDTRISDRLKKVILKFLQLG